jgi:PIN domain nuclease of toxin-antitoxin system
VTALLLDTNAFAMALTDDPRLPPAARDRLEGAVRAAVSVISFCEIGQKVRLGKWPEMDPHLAGLEAQARADGYDLVPLTAHAALEAATLDWAHRDPFDRMIAAVARAEGLTLLSSDGAFDALGLTRVWT